MPEQNKPIQRIIIVGGGTAGWLTANHLAKALKPKDNSGIEITLVESPNIPTIGVGEGTVPLIRQSLLSFGISETEFINECDVTFKQGIKFVNWVNNPQPDQAQYYHHVFDYPQLEPLDLTHYWLNQLSKNGTSFVDAMSVQGQVCDLNLAPKTITTPEYQGMTAYAYHLDAGKFAQLLQRNAVDNLGVKHLKADVDRVTLTEDGAIAELITTEMGSLAADFYVDCTGFTSLLLGQALDVPFIDKSDVLFADHAVVMQVPYRDKQQVIPSYTQAIAQNAGWLWDIGLTQRKGIGHVYSSAHCSHQQAEQVLRQYAGNNDLPTRVIEMHVGYREKFWHKNCVAIGLSQGFVEPLEATGLLVFDATAKMLAEQFPASTADLPLVADQFNQRVTYSWEKVIDFIKLHYCLSKRDDSDFWLDNRAPSSIPNSLQERLERWKYQPPSKYDFFSGFEIFNLENYLYVLYGMHYPTDTHPIAYRFADEHQAKQQWQRIRSESQQAIGFLPKHRELLDKIKRYGLQPN